jgi:CO/xanthine dehydrogenase Mo-binding subunit
MRSCRARARPRALSHRRCDQSSGVAGRRADPERGRCGRARQLPRQGEIPDTKVVVPPYPVLARDEVRHIGDAIAFVVAESIEAAKDAAEAIAIDWEPLPRPTPVVNAILDALWRAYRIQHLDMPATPERL